MDIDSIATNMTVKDNENYHGDMIEVAYNSETRRYERIR